MQESRQKKLIRGSKRLVACLLAILLVVTSFGVPESWAGDLGLPSNPDVSGPALSGKYIVVYEQPQVRGLGLRSSSVDPSARIKEQLQSQTRATFDLINGALVEMTPEEAESLAAEPGVAFVEPDYEVYALSQTVPWGVERIYEKQVYPFPSWSVTSGAGIGVAILDTGIQGSHEDLPALDGGVSFIDGSVYYTDGNGHGTHVGGIVAAQINSVGVVGVAPGVDLYSVQVLSSSGSGTISGIVAGIEWAVANDIRIISMSLGTKTYSQALKDACDAAYEAGCLVIAAAGNSGDVSGTGSNMEYPAKLDSVIAVGATDDNDRRAWFSSTGSELELMAPGATILSTYPSTTLTGRVVFSDIEYQYDFSSSLLVGSGMGSVSGPVVFCREASNADSVAAILLEKSIGPDDAWIALIDRGDSTFAQKVSLVMSLGAEAAVIVNNDRRYPNSSGKFTLNDGGTVPPASGWCPAVSISYNSGNIIKDSIDLSGAVSVGYDPYKTMSGTSMATPHVAGAAAVIWAAAPSLTNMEIRQILNGTALDLGLLDSQQGSGLVQLNAALDLAEAMTTDRVLDLVSLDQDPGTVTAELALCVFPGTSGTVYFALYDAEGRFLACSAAQVNVTAYRQTLTISANCDAAKTPAKMKAFFVAEGTQPLGAHLEILVP